MRQTLGAAVALMRVSSQRRKGVSNHVRTVFLQVTHWLSLRLLSAQCNKKNLHLPDKISNKSDGTNTQEGERASTDFISGRIVLSLFVPFSCCMLDCLSVCMTSLGVKHKLIRTPRPIAPSLQKTQSATKSKWLFLSCKANSRFIIGQT